MRVLPFFLSLLCLLLPPVLHSAEKPQNGFLPAAIGKSLSLPETSNKPSQEMADDAVTLRDMGAGGPLLLTGTEEGESFWFGVSTDEVVHRATLQIRFTQHVTRLGDLVRNADELQVKGAKQGPIRLEFRIPPDLLIWEHSEIGLKLNYRYTPPITEEQSYLSLYTNGNLLKSLRLKPSTDQSSFGQRIRLVDQQHAYSEDFRIPAFQLGADNTLDLRFFSSDYRQGWCMANSVDSFLASIDADSTIDFRGFHHYVAMPDLGSFAQSGFPFTKLADLGETRVLLPAEPSEHDIQAMLVMLSEMGLSTGVPAVRFEIQLGEDTTHLHDRDLLVISTESTHPLIRQWASFSPASFDNEARTFGQAFEWNRIFRFTDLESFSQKIRHIGASRFKACGALAALTGFESPVQKGRSVISFEANDPEEAHHALLTFSEKSTLRYVDDDVAIFRKGEVQS